jgi:hypothetical protein
MPESPVRPATLPCPAVVRLADGSQLDVVFWLLSDPSRAGGYTPLDVLFDGPRTFLAVRLASGESALVSRDAVLTIELDAASRGVPDLPEAGAAFDVLTLHLDSGLEVSGILRSWAPEGATRMSDVINAAGRFVPLGLGDRIVLVSTARIVRVSF